MYVFETKKSKFIAYAYNINSKDEVEPIIKSLKHEHKSARHICYAFLINGSAGMSDDGEPKGTAGKPLLNLLLLKKQDNKLIVVVRYFGGVKLGAGGLIRAYVAAAKEEL